MGSASLSLKKNTAIRLKHHSYSLSKLCKVQCLIKRRKKSEISVGCSTLLEHTPNVLNLNKSQSSQKTAKITISMLVRSLTVVFLLNNDTLLLQTVASFHFTNRLEFSYSSYFKLQSKYEVTVTTDLYLSNLHITV